MSDTMKGIRVMRGGRYVGNLHLVRYLDLMREDDLIVTSEEYTTGLILKRFDRISLLEVETIAAGFKDRLTIEEAKFLRRYCFAILIEDSENKVDCRWFESEDDAERIWSEAQRVAREDPDIDAELVPRASDGSPIH